MEQPNINESLANTPSKPEETKEDISHTESGTEEHEVFETLSQSEQLQVDFIDSANSLNIKNIPEKRRRTFREYMKNGRLMRMVPFVMLAMASFMPAKSQAQRFEDLQKVKTENKVPSHFWNQFNKWGKAFVLTTDKIKELEDAISGDEHDDHDEGERAVFIDDVSE